MSGLIILGRPILYTYNHTTEILYIQSNLDGWGFHLHFHLIRTARVKIQTSGCSIFVLLPGAMASIKHKGVVRTT